MNDIINFLNTHYKNAIKLVENFNITKEKEWQVGEYINELYVQVGHVYNVIFNDSLVNEEKRDINNLGDELSDVLLQIINISKVLNVNMYDIVDYNNYYYDNINGLSILLGQLTEAIMEMNEYRFKKNRSGFSSSYEFVKDRLYKLFIIAFNISRRYNLDMNEEFSKMLNDANKFLKNFKNNNEYIDIYDENEHLLGYSEKIIAHKKGYWHKTIGCLIFDKSRKSVFFQYKNPKHNRINNKPLYEITVGGHLVSGETLENSVREIKEETGLNIKYDDLNFILKRKCNKKIKKNYIIKEFQYYYSFCTKMSINDFKNYDKSEVLGFIEVNIGEVIKLFQRKISSINALNNEGKNIIIKLSDFDKAYVDDGLYLDLLTRLNEKISLNSVYKLFKMYISNKNKYYFNNGKVINNVDYSKNKFKYSVMIVNKDRNKKDYICYILIIYRNKVIPGIFAKNFNSRNKALEYSKKLSNIIINNTNDEIINICFHKKINAIEM